MNISGPVMHAPAQPSRLSIDQTFQLPEGQRKQVDELIRAEQWLEDLGARVILTGLASGDWNEIRRGAERLRAALAAERLKGRAEVGARLAAARTNVLLWAAAAGLAGVVLGFSIGLWIV